MRVEHVFAAMTQMAGMTVRTIGIERMRVGSTMKALSDTLKRLEVLIRRRKIPIDGIGGQPDSGGNGTPPQSQRNGKIQGKLPALSIRPLNSLNCSPHDTRDDRLIEDPIRYSSRSHLDAARPARTPGFQHNDDRPFARTPFAPHIKTLRHQLRLRNPSTLPSRTPASLTPRSHAYADPLTLRTPQHRLASLAPLWNTIDPA